MKYKFVLITSILIFTLSTSLIAQAQWVQTNGPYGTWSSLLCVADSTIFAGNTSIDPIAALRSGDKAWRGTKFPLPFNRYVMAITAIGQDIIVGVDSGITGSEGNSVYRSIDGGVNWQLSSTGIDDNSIQCFAVNDSFVFAGSYEHGVFRSSDSGVTWAGADSGLDYAMISSLVAIPGYVFTGIEGADIFRSSNNGVSWTEVDSTLPPHYGGLTALLFKDSGNKVFASISTEGVYSSTDLGLSWHSANNGLTDSNVNKIIRCGAILVAATNGGIFLSRDDGGTWGLSNNGLSNTIVGDLVIRGSTLFISTANGIFCSIDTGQSWMEIDSGMRSLEEAGALLKDGTKLFAGTPSGIYLSTNDGQLWSQRSAGLTDVWITALAIIHSAAGPILFAGTSSGPFRSTDYGNSWTLIDSGFPNFPSDYPSVYSFATIDTILFATAGYGNLVRSTNYGSTWQKLIGPSTSSFQIITSRGSTLFASGSWDGGGCVFLSNDEGRSWDILSQFSNIGYARVNSLLIDTDISGSTRLYAAAYGGVALSTDLGESWQTSNWGLDSLDLESISCFATCDSLLLAGGPTGFFYSSIIHGVWTKFDSGLIDPYIYAISQQDSNLFIGTDSGVWHRALSQITSSGYMLGSSADTLVFWNIPVGHDSLAVVTLTNSGKYALTIQSFQLTPADSVFSTSDLSSAIELQPGEQFTFEILFSPTKPGVFSAGVTIFSEAETALITLIGMSPDASEVQQPSQSTQTVNVHPNPFSQSTNITFTSEAAGYADVSIVNLLGVDVAHLFSGELSAGEHSFAWNNSTGLPDGMYECLVRMNGRVETLPVVLAR